jgi:hypothetical protein
MSLAATQLQEIRVKNPDFDKNEHRLSEYGALDFFIQQSDNDPLLTQEMKAKARESAGKTLKIPVIQHDGDVVVSNVRSCVVADAENTSALVGVTFATYSTGFTIVPAMYSNNEIDRENDLAKKLKKCARALGAALDNAAIAALEAAKTQVIADSLIYTFSSDILSVDWDAREDILGDIEPMMNSNDFYGFVHIIGNAGVRSLIGKLAEKAEYNEVNKTLEWRGKYFHYSNRIQNDTNQYATFYAVESGNVDLLFRYDRETILEGAGAGHTWEMYNMPYINIPVGLHHYVAVGDQSAIAGDATADLTCARKEYFGFSVDVAFVVAYNSNLSTRANPIMKAQIAGGSNYARPVRVVTSNDDPLYTKTAS